MDESLAVIVAELRRIADEEVPAEELSRARENLKGRLVLGAESAANRMNRLGRAVLGGNEVLTIDEVIARVDAVTAADVAALAGEFWRPERLSLAAITTDGSVVDESVSRHMPHLMAA
jgi:predicted Zn-dependent peptidase